MGEISFPFFCSANQGVGLDQAFKGRFFLFFLSFLHKGKKKSSPHIIEMVDKENDEQVGWDREEAHFWGEKRGRKGGRREKRD